MFQRRDKRALVLGALILAPALAFFLVVRPYLESRTDTMLRKNSESRQLASGIALVNNLDTIRDRLRTSSDMLMERASRLFAGDSPELAAAALADYVREIAGLGRVYIQKMRPGSSEAADPGITILKMHLSGESDLEGLLTFLNALEAGPKLVHVTDLAIRATPESYTNGYEVLTISAVLNAFTLVEGPDSLAAPISDPRFANVARRAEGSPE